MARSPLILHGTAVVAVSLTAVPVAVAACDNVMVVELLTVTIDVPAGMPVPVTICPARSVALPVIPLTVVDVFVVLPAND